MIQPLKSDNPMFTGLINPRFTKLSDKPRTQTAVEASEIITNMTLNYPVSEWNEVMDNLDIMSHYDRTFTAIIAVVL
jgi:hypothetical protein